MSVGQHPMRPSPAVLTVISERCTDLFSQVGLTSVVILFCLGAGSTRWVTGVDHFQFSVEGHHLSSRNAV